MKLKKGKSQERPEKSRPCCQQQQRHPFLHQTELLELFYLLILTNQELTGENADFYTQDKERN